MLVFIDWSVNYPSFFKGNLEGKKALKKLCDFLNFTGTTSI